MVKFEVEPRRLKTQVRIYCHHRRAHAGRQQAGRSKAGKYHRHLSAL
jgi:hypothetical protein